MEEDDPYNPKLTYLSDYPKLPIDAPVGHPHLVDPGSVSEEFPQAELTIADLVVTVLFKYMPEALTAFLDLDRPEVHYIQGGGSTRLDFCIKRDKRVVTVGFLNEKEVGGWDILFQYHIKGNATGTWTPIRYGTRVGHNVTKAEEVQKDAPSFVFNILSHEPWSRASGEEIEWVNGLSYCRTF